MSLEQSFSQKLTLDKEVSSSSTNSSENPPHHSGGFAAGAAASSNSTSSGNKPPLPPPISKGHSLRNIGRRRPSPLRNQQSLNRQDSIGGSGSGSHSGSGSSSFGVGGGGSGSPVHSFAASNVGGVDRAHSIRLTRKIFHNWRSACGKTKDKTKDFIRRWKTLPENHPDFDHLVPQPGGSSNIPGSTSASLCHAEAAHTHSGGGGGTGGFSKIKNLAKKSSEHDLPTPGGGGGGGGGGSGSGHHSTPHVLGRSNTITQDEGSSSTAAGKSSTGWTVHVWATWVQRGSCEDAELSNNEETPGRDFLSDFQKVKLTHFFRHVLDMNHDDVISAADFVALNQRIRHYIEWSSECIEFHILKEVHSGFLECFLNQPLDDCSLMYYCSSERETRQHVNVEEWLDVWGGLLHSARNLEALPLWLQYFPKILFQVINKSGSGTVSKEELRAFYTMFLGIDFRVVNETLDSIYNAMTDGARNKINYGLFKLCFTNFLLAKFPHGPGQYLFGICSPQTLRCSFPIDYSALNTSPDDLEPYDPEKDKSQTNRRSVIV